MTDEFPIIPEKTAMLFFDTLNGSLSAEASAALKGTGYIDRLQRIERACRESGIAIFYTLPEHRQDGKDWGLTVIGDPPRITNFRGTNYKGSRHATVLDDIVPQEGDYIITKHRWSAFFQTCLELSLRTAGIDTIMLAGGSVQVGIASTAYSTRDRDFNLIILRDVIRGSPDLTNVFLNQIFPGLARVMTIDEATSKFALVGSPT